MRTVALCIIVILSMTTGYSANGDEGNPRVIEDGIQRAPDKQRAGVATLRADNASIAVLLAKLMPATDEAHNRAIDALNARIDEIAALSTAASPVIVVDQNTGFDAVRDTYDGIHPNASGEARLAEAWFRPLAALLGGSPKLAGRLARTQPSRETWEATEISLNHTRTH